MQARKFPRFIVSYPIKIDSEGLDAQSPTASQFEFSGTETHHIRDVLRLTAGEQVEVFSTQTKQSYLCTITATDGARATARAESQIVRGLDSKQVLTLVVASVKTQNCELITEKATELGATRVVFYSANRGERAPDKNKFPKRLERLTKIRDSALKQSYSSCYTSVAIEGSLLEALTTLHQQARAKPQGEKQTQIRLACLAPGQSLTELGSQVANSANPLKLQPTTISELFTRFGNPDPTHSKALEKIAEDVEIYIVIGPEGGFSDSELEVLASWAYQPLSLGANVLRTETAAILACGLLLNS